VKISQVLDYILFFVLAGTLAGCGVQPTVPDSGPRYSTTSESDETARGRARIHAELAANYLQVRNLGVALEEAGIAQRSDPNYGPAYNVAGLIYIQLKDDRMAEESFRQALRIDPNDSNSHNNYGAFLCDRQREAEGIKHFMQAVRDPLYRTPDQAFYNAGVCARRRGDQADAEGYFRNAVQLQPNHLQALYQLADMSYAAGRYREAQSYLSRLSRVASGSPQVLWLMLRTHNRLGDRGAVDSLSRELRNKFPESREADLLAAGRFD
jgi:type IV pilus assembly protein PilF